MFRKFVLVGALLLGGAAAMGQEPGDGSLQPPVAVGVKNGCLLERLGVFFNGNFYAWINPNQYRVFFVPFGSLVHAQPELSPAVDFVANHAGDYFVEPHLFAPTTVQ